VEKFNFKFPIPCLYYCGGKIKEDETVGARGAHGRNIYIQRNFILIFRSDKTVFET